MMKGILKKVVGLMLAFTAPICVLTSCASKADPEKVDGVMIIKETDQVYTMHKSKWVPKIDANYTTVCGYTAESDNYGESIGHVDKHIELHNVEWRVYPSKEDIHPALLEQTELCDECFPENEQ